jgi:phage N-6-adenine-methyltransferase
MKKNRSKLMSVMGSSKTDNWGSPKWLFRALDTVFHFDLDAAASPENALCKRFLTIDDRYFYMPEYDSLSLDWSAFGQTIWLNPPYGRAAAKFIAKARDESRAGLTVVCLIASRTGSGWLHSDFVGLSRQNGEASAATFLPGRLSFELPNGETTGPAPFDSLITVFSQLPLKAEQRLMLNTLGAVWPREQGEAA